MKWQTIQGCVAGALLAGALGGCGGEVAHVSAGVLEPDPQPAGDGIAAPAPAAQRNCANAGMMNTPSTPGRRCAD